MASSSSRSEVDEDRFFFGKITSEEANEILRKEGGEEGTFLVRESCSSPGNYVVSFIAERLPIHILVQKYHEDAFFSLVIEGDAPLFHGLDSLINYYCQNPVGNSDNIFNRPCCGEPLPAEVRLHGYSSLLHRSTNEGNLTVVSELLKSGYKKLDDKNNNGQTALHIASMKGHKEIVEMLVEASALVEVRDEEGLTPLHLACRHNRPDVVRLLVSLGRADIQARATKTGSVSLHEAAKNGSFDAIQVLLSYNAPAHPQNKSKETPAALAKTEGHMECYRFLLSHHSPKPQLQMKDYYHGNIDRHVAQRRLLDGSTARSGHFLLRRSMRKQDVFVLTLFYESEVYNYEISGELGFLHIDDGPIFSAVEYLVDHYAQFADGLPCRLVKPVPPPSHPVESPFRKISTTRSHLEFHENTNHTSDQCLPPSVAGHINFTSPEKLDNARIQKPDIIVTHSVSPLSPMRTQTASQASKSPIQSKVRSRDNLKLDLKTLPINNPVVDGASNNNGSSPTMDGNRTDEILGEIDISHLSVGKLLGNGEFGSVLKGKWLSPSGDQIDVAIKTLHIDDKVSKENFLKEAEVMMNLNHLYIVKLVGVCHGPPVAMVQELMAMGSLLDFLLEHAVEINVDFHLKLWGAQIAEGMAYLEQKHFVHRDLAARNILLSSLTLAKISDFGLSRALGENKDYYVATAGGKWPIKWYAPESILYGTFTHASDVWSYGITLWEMYTFGDQPYGDLPGQKVVDLLEKNERLPHPKKCPQIIFELMLQCWSYVAKKRPSFRDLARKFRTMPDYINIKPYYK